MTLQKTSENIGILLINLGTPVAADVKAVKHYLAEFLSDSHVVELPHWLWLPILHTIVLPVRSRKSAKLYKKIWTQEGSPLLVFSKKISQGLGKILQQEFNEKIKVVLAMRYGSPSIAEGLEFFRENNIQKLIILPLYPQYSFSATASTFDTVTKLITAWKVVPDIHFINQYSENINYINALATHIENFWEKHHRGEKLLFSFHGLPQKSIAKGDPYYSQCLKTSELTAKKLNLPAEKWQVVFQSRFGKQRWLEPYCDKTLQAFAKQGYKNIDIICPGFPADCLETLEEIAIRNRETFIEAGGQQLNYIPALNDSLEHLKALVSLVQQKL